MQGTLEGMGTQFQTEMTHAHPWQGQGRRKILGLRESEGHRSWVSEFKWESVWGTNLENNGIPGQGNGMCKGPGAGDARSSGQFCMLRNVVILPYSGILGVGGHRPHQLLPMHPHYAQMLRGHPAFWGKEREEGQEHFGWKRREEPGSPCQAALVLPAQQGGACR